MSNVITGHTFVGAAVGTPNTVTTPSVDTSGADFVIVLAGWYPVATPTLSDSKSNSYTGLTTISGSLAAGKINYKTSPTVGSSHTWTLAGTGTYPHLAVIWGTGMHLTPLDGQSGDSDATGTSHQAGSITPSENNCLAYAGLIFSAAITGLSINESFTIQDTTTGNSQATLVQGTAAPLNPTWSWTTSVESVALLAVFKAAATGGIILTPRRMLMGMGA